MITSMKSLPSQPTFSSADVVRAAGVSRAVFDAWLLRNVMPLPRGPGTGHSRRYTALDAVRIAAVADLVKAGLKVARAAQVFPMISESDVTSPRRARLRVPQPHGSSVSISIDVRALAVQVLAKLPRSRGR
jgi:hypothetical protein